MITYPEIFEILRREKYSEKLQELGKNFLSEVALYLKEKKALLERERAEKPEFFNETLERTKKQLENARAMLRELFMRREKKIVDLALVASKTGVSKSDLKTMLDYERELFEDVLKKIQSSEEKLLTIIEGVEIVEDNITIKFKEPVDRFVDLQGNELGPFKERDIANLPKKVADILINGNKAEIVNI